MYDAMGNIVKFFRRRKKSGEKTMKCAGEKSDGKRETERTHHLYGISAKFELCARRKIDTIVFVPYTRNSERLDIVSEKSRGI